jgi:hypothetical protein
VDEWRFSEPLVSAFSIEIGSSAPSGDTDFQVVLPKFPLQGLSFSLLIDIYRQNVRNHYPKMT